MVEDDGPGFDLAAAPPGTVSRCCASAPSLYDSERHAVGAARFRRARVVMTLPPMIRAFILDDERLAVERLTRLLTSGRVRVVGSQIPTLCRHWISRTDPQTCCFSISRCRA